MTKFEIENMAYQLLKQHGFHDAKVTWNGRKRALAYARYVPQSISLSRHLFPSLQLDEMKQVILHEIAHLKTGPGHGHDRAWKLECIKIGADYSRTYNGNSIKTTEKQIARFIGVCPTCGHEHFKHRRSKYTDYLCGKCRSQFTFQNNPHYRG